MSKINNGGPAFPCQWENGGDMNATAPDGQLVPPLGIVHMSGMSLRDHFAGLALPIVAGGNQVVGENFLRPENFPSVAHDAYRLADAMLAARSKALGQSGGTK